MSDARPALRLLPKAKPQAIRHGFPWVYANEAVMDRRTRALAPGALATLEGADRRPMGTVAVNPHSKIVGRMLDPDPDARIDGDWFRSRIAAAHAHRSQLYDAPFYRLVHAEADGLPGVVVDRFGDAAVIQPNAAWADTRLHSMVDALRDVTGITTVVKNASGRARQLEGLDDADAVLSGSLDGRVPVPMNGAIYLADLAGGQKTGLFFDQRENHAMVARFARGARVLDVFSHVGGFGLAALAAGADGVLAVDASQSALDLATAGAAASGVAERFSAHRSDAFEALETLGREGQRFDIVICDPPAFAPSKAAREAGLRAYERIARLAAPLVTDGGLLTLCSCSHAADLSSFRNACARGIGRGGQRGRIVHTGFAGPDHPIRPQLSESGYLKALVFRL